MIRGLAVAAALGRQGGFLQSTRSGLAKAIHVLVMVGIALLPLAYVKPARAIIQVAAPVLACAENPLCVRAVAAAADVAVHAAVIFGLWWTMHDDSSPTDQSQTSQQAITTHINTTTDQRKPPGAMWCKEGANYVPCASYNKSENAAGSAAQLSTTTAVIAALGGWQAGAGKSLDVLNTNVTPAQMVTWAITA